MLWLLNPLQIYKHSPTKLVWLVRKLLLPEPFTIQHIATTKDRVPFIVLSPYAVLPVRAYKRGARLQRTGRCRSVQRLFSENKNIGLLWAKVRRFCIKSTEVCIKEVRCFALPIHHYEIPPSTTLEAVSALLKKKFSGKNLHFLHPFTKLPLCTGFFGCRMGCRMLLLGVGSGAKHCQKV